MTIRQALAWANKKLRKKSRTSSLDADVLLTFVLKKSKEFLFTYPEKKITNSQGNKFKSLISRRLKNEPIAYLTNYKEFYGLDFYVDKNVLIPRPETEILIDEVIKKNQKLRIKNQAIVDVGTGSGCIAITLAKHLPRAKIVASDISKNALQVAKKNSRMNKVKIKFFHGNLLVPVKNIRIDIIVANLPYGWQQWKNNTSAETSSLKFEPQNSLFTKHDGLYLYSKLFKQIFEKKSKPKFIFVEFDQRQKINLQNLIKKYFPVAQIEIKKDLAGLNRLIIIKMKN